MSHNPDILIGELCMTPGMVRAVAIKDETALLDEIEGQVNADGLTGEWLETIGVRYVTRDIFAGQISLLQAMRDSETANETSSYEKVEVFIEDACERFESQGFMETAQPFDESAAREERIRRLLREDAKSLLDIFADQSHQTVSSIPPTFSIGYSTVRYETNIIRDMRTNCSIAARFGLASPQSFPYVAEQAASELNRLRLLVLP